MNVIEDSTYPSPHNKEVSLWPEAAQWVCFTSSPPVSSYRGSCCQLWNKCGFRHCGASMISFSKNLLLCFLQVKIATHCGKTQTFVIQDCHFTEPSQMHCTPELFLTCRAVCENSNAWFSKTGYLRNDNHQFPEKKFAHGLTGPLWEKHRTCKC